MKSALAKIDGFAARNTRDVLCAVAAYEQGLRSGGTKGEAVTAAATVYKSVSGKSATARTVRRWLRAVKSYGGAEKTPLNAFGARKACPHVARPARDLLRQIKAVVARLAREPFDPRAVAEMTVASHLLGELLGAALHNPVACHLITIKALASRMGNTPAHQLHRFTSAQEMEVALRGILVRLKGISEARSKAAA